MKSALFHGLIAGCLFALGTLNAGEGLDGRQGRVFKVNPQGRTFEFLTETLVDPQTREGKSRHVIHWDDHTTFNQVLRQDHFGNLAAGVVAVFEDLSEEDSRAIREGRPFSARSVTILPEKRATGFSNDWKSYSGILTPDPGSDKPRSGTIAGSDGAVKVSLLRRGVEVRIRTTIDAAEMARGFWDATVWGAEHGEDFLLSHADLEPLVDPRSVDDPGLPRVLVVGDSISMNYHTAAKAALAGKANYYRVEGNGGPSDHGVAAMDLWLGEYTEEGLGWDVIQFNHGLHDLKQAFDEKTGGWGAHQVSIEDYQRNLEEEITMMKKTGATLVWCSTTPVPNNSKGPYARRKGEEVIFNAAAMEVVGRHPEILVTDLHRAVSESPEMDEWRKGTDVHFWQGDLQEVVGQAVADGILQALDRRKDGPGGGSQR